MKRLAFVLVVLACVCAVALPQVAFADVQEDLQTEIENGLNNLDFSQMEQVASPFFENFAQKVRQIINGEFDSAQSFWQLLCQLFNSGVSEILPQLITVFCVIVVCGLVRNTSDGFISAETSNVVSFVGVSVFSVTTLSLVAKAYGEVAQMLAQTALLTDAAMPVLLTLVVANGGSASSAVCQPSMVMFSSVIINVVKNVLLPLSVFAMAFVVVSNVSSNVRVEKASKFLCNASSWLLGILFTLYSAFTSVQGITASSIDGVSFRAAKFAAKNYIPVLGGYISDGFDVVVASTSLIKNSFGAVSMLLMFFVAVKPLVTLVCLNLGLQAVCALGEPIADGKYIKI
ncbi:MAG: hypothetical protein ACI4QL_04905, partial [Candidatus Fimimonas sp.]